MQQAGGAARLFVAAGASGRWVWPRTSWRRAKRASAPSPWPPPPAGRGVGRTLLEQSLAALKAEGAESCFWRRAPPTPRPWRCTGGWALPAWACAGAFTAPRPRTRSYGKAPVTRPFLPPNSLKTW